AEVAGGKPGGQVPNFLWALERRSDPQAGDAQPELVVVHPAQCFPKRFADTVIGIRPQRALRPYALADSMEAGGVVRRREYDPRTAFEAGGLEYGPGSAQVGVEDVLERSFDRLPGQ